MNRISGAVFRYIPVFNTVSISFCPPLQKLTTSNLRLNGNLHECLCIMSSQPILIARFAEAIQDLPAGNLHTKAAEIHNSILQLEHSNDELQTFARQGDGDCADAIVENVQVISRMKERLSLLRSEVVRRGLLWPDDVEKNLPLSGPGFATGMSGNIGTAEHARLLSSSRSSNGAQSDAEEREHGDSIAESRGVHL